MSTPATLRERPGERCGAPLPPFEDAPRTECVLRPRHQGSHANEYDVRWIDTSEAGYCPHCGRGDAGPTADQYEASQRRAARFADRISGARAWARRNLTDDQQAGLFSALLGDLPSEPNAQSALERILVDADHHDHCAAHSKTDEGRICHSSIAGGLRIAAEHVRRGAHASIDQARKPRIGPRPTHPDGTPYRYHEIVAEGWDVCDYCGTWGQGWTAATPHTCPNEPKASTTPATT